LPARRSAETSAPSLAMLGLVLELIMSWSVPGY
jgi:hypothetical protein